MLAICRNGQTSFGLAVVASLVVVFQRFHESDLEGQPLHSLQLLYKVLNAFLITLSIYTPGSQHWQSPPTMAKATIVAENMVGSWSKEDMIRRLVFLILLGF